MVDVAWDSHSWCQCWVRSVCKLCLSQGSFGMFTTAHSVHMASCSGIGRSPSSHGHGHSWHGSELQGEAPSAVKLQCPTQPWQVLFLSWGWCSRSLCAPFSFRVGYHRDTVNFFTVGGMAAPTFLLEWQLGCVIYLRPCINPWAFSSPRIYGSCRGTKCVWWMCLFTLLLLQLLFFCDTWFTRTSLSCVAETCSQSLA